MDQSAPGPLVTSGVFSQSRNPIFLSMDLFLIGAFGLNGQILHEERILGGLYGEPCARYRSHAGRYWGAAHVEVTMLLNWVERALMNNPVRKGVQSYFEAGRLLDLGGPMDGGTALEIGCGRGVGVELILERFGADRVVAMDLDPQMVDLASLRLEHLGERAQFQVGDVTEIDAPADAFDAVFDFGIIHHVPDWRLALRELHRVLKPGGTFYGEEVWQRFLSWRVVDLLLEHPREDRFDPTSFYAALADVGFEVVARRDMADVFGWFVARRRDEPSPTTSSGNE